MGGGWHHVAMTVRSRHSDRPAALVRPAAATDFDAWFRLFAAVAGEGRWLGSELPMDRERRLEFFKSALPGERSVVFVAQSGPDGPLSGSLGVVLSNAGPSGGGLADLGMFVAAGERAAGVGTALMEAAAGWARARHAHKLTLEVWPHNHAARALYAKCGFVTEGRKRRHWQRRDGALWDAVVMGLVLDETAPGGPEPSPPVVGLAFPGEGLTGSDGLVVRPWARGDLPTLAAALGDPGVNEWLNGSVATPTEEAAQGWVASARVAATDGTGLRLAVCSGGVPAGCLHLHVDPHDRAAGSFGYLLFPPARGRGMATGAVRALTAWALGPGAMRRLEIMTDVDNRASRAVAERAGYRLEGIRAAWRVVDGQPRDFASYARVSVSDEQGEPEP